MEGLAVILTLLRVSAKAVLPKRRIALLIVNAFSAGVQITFENIIAGRVAQW
jgi:hypothetical protein